MFWVIKKKRHTGWFAWAAIWRTLLPACVFAWISAPLYTRISIILRFPVFEAK
jgi:hypothetical protein